MENFLLNLKWFLREILKCINSFFPQVQVWNNFVFLWVFLILKLFYVFSSHTGFNFIIFMLHTRRYTLNSRLKENNNKGIFIELIILCVTKWNKYAFFLHIVRKDGLSQTKHFEHEHNRNIGSCLTVKRGVQTKMFPRNILTKAADDDFTGQI